MDTLTRQKIFEGQRTDYLSPPNISEEDRAARLEEVRRTRQFLTSPGPLGPWAQDFLQNQVEPVNRQYLRGEISPDDYCAALNALAETLNQPSPAH